MSKKVAHIFEKKWRSDDVKLEESVDFSALLLSERVLQGLQKAGFKKPSPVQLESIPIGKFGKDLIVQAKSGTGKTLVFVIIALEMLQRKMFRPQVLVVVPTREIAIQVCSVVRAVGSSFSKLACNSFIGGLPLVEDQQIAYITQIVVGTPGRLKQLIELKSLPTSSIRLLIFDEADDLLHTNVFKEDIEDIFKSLPDEKQVIATSATFNHRVRKILLRYLCDPKVVRLNAKKLALLGMVHYAVVVDYCPMPVISYRSKLKILENILKSVKFAQCLLFVNGIQRVEVLYRDIKRLGFSTSYISSAREQADRSKVIERLKRFKCKVLVSSDLTSRGIDAENVDLVINFDLAYYTDVYMHRVGRAGRFGSVGVAISIIDTAEQGQMQRIQREGSFNTLKLPNPIPKDLILYPLETEILFDEVELEKVQSNDAEEVKDSACNDAEEVKDSACNDAEEVKDSTSNDVEKVKATKPTKPKKNKRKRKYSHSIKETDADNLLIKETSDINLNIRDNVCVEASSKLATQSADDDNVTTHDDITNNINECEINVEEVGMNNISDSEDNTHPDEQISDKLNNVYTDISDVKLGKNFVSTESCDKTSTCDVPKQINVLHYNNEYEEKGVVNDEIKDDLKLNGHVSNVNIEEADFEVVVKELAEMHVQNGLEFSEMNCAVENIKDDIEKCEQMLSNVNEKDAKHESMLNNMVKEFVNTYESSKSVNGTKPEISLDNDSHSNENSGKKVVTIDMINNLNSQKNEFFYKTFKKFVEKNSECSVAYKDDTVDIKSPDNSEIENKEAFTDKPNFESTPQTTDKVNQNTVKITPDEAVCEPGVQNKLNALFQGCSDGFEYNVSDSVEEESEIVKQSSSIDSESGSSSNDDSSTPSSSSDSYEDSDSETDSSSSLSESDSISDYSDSSSSTTTSSVSEDDASNYHHDSSRTGRQNPSLIYNSMMNQMFNYDRLYQGRTCACCGAAVSDRPRRRRNRSPEIESENALFFRRALAQSYYMPPNFLNEITNSRRAFQTAARQEQNFTDRTVPETSRRHSRHHRSRNSSIRIPREDDQSRSERPSLPRSYRHYHAPCCFLPSEHRCHPNTPEHCCSRGALCEMWYRMFYDQCMHIRNVRH